MATVDVIVDKLLTLWRIPAVRDYFPAIFALISIVGSGLKELDVVPQTYFSNSRNVVNMYFVKVSWGWTLMLLTPFILLSNFSFKRNVSYVFSRALSLVVATATWYIFTEIFFHIEEMSGSCIETGTNLKKEEFTSKATCRHAGFHWDGFDISGHSFILTYSALFIKEEMVSMTCVKTSSFSALPKMVANLLYVALNLIVIIWVWMFACTSVYFHDFIHKLIGTGLGLLSWYVTYRLWYKHFLPGLPPIKEPKQHA
ncbi:acyl-coenzyme A diphosphatase FITM2 [Lates calcarifer]|uniref:Acyl-coenzyme A diphosphatase FITM2 n=1 Tax=Lates calcarifer TaxID=8187 RepID=A0A4W6D2Z0_LATCA|nr:acyl-coenzyme A diphosphatase FITM2 [Lates calcarifer]